MKYRMLDKNNDWMFGAGYSSYCKDEKAVETGVVVSLRTIQGENWFGQNVGLPWISLMAQKQIRKLDLLMIRDYINSCRGVMGVSNIELKKENRKIKLKYNLQTVYNYTVEGSTDIEVF